MDYTEGEDLDLNYLLRYSNNLCTLQVHVGTGPGPAFCGLANVSVSALFTVNTYLPQLVKEIPHRCPLLQSRYGVQRTLLSLLNLLSEVTRTLALMFNVFSVHIVPQHVAPIICVSFRTFQRPISRAQQRLRDIAETVPYMHLILTLSHINASFEAM